MTRAEVVAFTKRMALRLARGDVSAHPVSEEQKRRFENLARQEKQDEEERQRQSRRA